MIDFSFEILNDTNINIEYIYGSEKFIFNLFQRQEYWTIHPFDGILLQNRDLCRNVLIDLFRNKHFQIMLAKENISLTSLRTSIDLDPESHIESVRVEDEVVLEDDLQQYIDRHSLEEILAHESERMEERARLVGNILQKMFMANYGPGDPEFDKLNELLRSYKEVQQKLRYLSGQ